MAARNVGLLSAFFQPKEEPLINMVEVEDLDFTGPHEYPTLDFSLLEDHEQPKKLDPKL